jgi:YQGE family putative transporter
MVTVTKNPDAVPDVGRVKLPPLILDNGKYIVTELSLITLYLTIAGSILIYGIGCLLFMVGALLNATLYSALGVILFMMCLLFARPLLDIAYFPIQLKVIDYVAEKEKRNEFSYIFNHELGLYLGRLFGCGLFIVLARYVSEYAALRYALLVIAVLHALGWFMAKSILKEKELA